jgi:hypothetical protein
MNYHQKRIFKGAWKIKHQAWLNMNMRGAREFEVVTGPKHQNQWFYKSNVLELWTVPRKPSGTIKNVVLSAYNYFFSTKTNFFHFHKFQLFNKLFPPSPKSKNSISNPPR